jgi:hypothetical protein
MVLERAEGDLRSSRAGVTNVGVPAGAWHQNTQGRRGGSGGMNPRRVWSLACHVLRFGSLMRVKPGVVLTVRMAATKPMADQAIFSIPAEAIALHPPSRSISMSVLA